jgi:hypothetical protein
MTVMLICSMAIATDAECLQSSAQPPRADRDQQFEQLLTMIKPAPNESLWSDIPWMMDLPAARKKAAAEGKPLVVWTMSGEPLGHC